MTYSKDSSWSIDVIYVQSAPNSSCVFVDVILVERTHGVTSSSVWCEAFDGLGALAGVSIISTSLGMSLSSFHYSSSCYPFFMFNLESHKIAGSLNLKHVVHYYKLTFHCRHFHCRSDKSVSVILLLSVGPIGRPRKESNRQLNRLRYV